MTAQPDDCRIESTATAPPADSSISQLSDVLLPHWGDHTANGPLDQFAPNAVLEWFGRTVRGPARIQQFFRYDVHAQYEQHFRRVQSSEPIESKPSHLRTRELPADHQQSAHRFEPLASDATSTPVQNRIPCVVPHAPAQGRIFRSSISHNVTTIASDDDELDASLAATELPRTPPPRLATDETAAVSPVLARERKARTKPSAANRSIDSMESDSPPQTPSLPCDLHYAESIGVIRPLSATAVAAGQRPADAPSTQWDRDVRLRISFRVREADASLQFALIVYEQLQRNQRTCRNLLADFGRTDIAADDGQQTPCKVNGGAPEMRSVPRTDVPKASKRAHDDGADGWLRRCAATAMKTPRDPPSAGRATVKSSLKRLRF